MIKFIVVIRMSNGELVAISDDEVIAEFDSELDAAKFMKKHILFILDWEVIRIGV